MTDNHADSYMNAKNCKEVMCGCFYCIQSYHGSTITEFTDEGETALCPLCGMDSVLNTVTDPVILQAIHDRWFKDNEEIKNHNQKESKT